jgi:hypothetical protein
MTDMSGAKGPGTDPPAEPNHGLNLVFRPDALMERRVIRLPNSRVGIECPIGLMVRGPVILGDRTVVLGARLFLHVAERRYMVKAMELDTMDSEDEIDPEMLREIRWGEVFAGALETLGRVVTVDEDGAELIHKGVVTLTDEERVGALWLQARLAGLEANKHIAEQFGISTTAAAARVKRARESGIIPPARQGQRR